MPPLFGLQTLRWFASRERRGLLRAVGGIKGLGLLLFEGQFELVTPFALDELRVALGAVTLSEVDAVLLFGGGGLVTGAVRAGLNDMHYRAVLVRVAADIVWVVTHQYPPHRINSYVKLNFRHLVFGNGCALADALHHRGAPCLHSSVCKRFAGLHPEKEEDSSLPSEGLLRIFCPSTI